MHNRITSDLYFFYFRLGVSSKESPAEQNRTCSHFKRYFLYDAAQNTSFIPTWTAYIFHNLYPNITFLILCFHLNNVGKLFFIMLLMKYVKEILTGHHVAQRSATGICWWCDGINQEAIPFENWNPFHWHITLWMNGIVLLHNLLEIGLDHYAQSISIPQL